MKQRQHWCIAQNEDFSECNFIWNSWLKERHVKFLKHIKPKLVNQEDAPERKWKNLKLYSRIECNYHLTNKKGLLLSMKEYYQKIGKEPFLVLPLTYNVSSLADHEFKLFEK